MNNNPTQHEDLYRTAAFNFSKPSQHHSAGAADMHHHQHSRHPSNGSSHSSYSLGNSSTLNTPSDSPPLDFLNSPAAGGGAKLLVAAGPRHETGPIRRVRQDGSLSSSPYPSQPPLRSASFSGSDSHRSSSSEAEDLNSIFPYGNNNGGGVVGGMQHSHHDYSSAASMYAHQNRSASALNVDPNASFQRMNINSDQALEQLAANVRAATTTSASDRAKHIFVQAWLNANYAPYQDGNVPRQGLYNSYRRVCDEYRIPHVNTATLGKAIRLCFPAIKTRRLGVRGNSKYHYCGIRPSTASEAEWLQDFINRTNNTRNQSGAGGNRPTSQSGRSSSANEDSPDDDEDDDTGNESSHSTVSSSHHSNSGGGVTSNGLPHLSLRGSASGGGAGNQSGRRSPVYFSMSDDKTPTVGGFNTAQSQALNGAGGMPSYTSLRRRAADGIVASNVSAFNARLGGGGGQGAGVGGGASGGGMGTLRPGQSVRTLRGFPDVEEAIGQGAPPASDLLSVPSATGSGGPTPSSTDPTTSPSDPSGPSSSQFAATAREVWRWFEEHLDQLIESVRAFRFDQYELQIQQFWAGLQGEQREIVHAPAVAGLMAKADALVYDEILEILRSQLLVTIPPHVLTALRQLADKTEKLLLNSLEGYGTTFVEPKVELGARFGHLVLRFLDIYQVTQALASVMSNPKQLQDMARSWRDIDFESVRNQAALVCNCRHEDLHGLLEVEFVAVLDGLMTSQEPVRDIIVWADAVCDRLIGAHTNGPSGANGEDRVTMSSRSLLIRWGYVTSQIMRDLTIRSDPAFGAFQILKLFMDDWIALNVLRNVALSTNSVAASVEPTMHNQFLALSPGGSQFTSGPSHGGIPPHLNTASHHNMHHQSQMMAHTPTTASMIAAMGDPFGASASMTATASGGASQFQFEPLSFSAHLDPSAGTYDFSGHGMAMDVVGSSGGHNHFGQTQHQPTDVPSSADSEMSSPARGDDGMVKVENNA